MADAIVENHPINMYLPVIDEIRAVLQLFDDCLRTIMSNYWQIDFAHVMICSNWRAYDAIPPSNLDQVENIGRGGG